MSEKPRGPVMLVATEALTPPKVRIGRITRDITLPRTVPLASLLAGGAGVLVGLVVAGFTIGWGLAPMTYGSVVGGAIGVFLVNYSPLKGESLAKWLGLKMLSRRRNIEVDGKTVRLAVGVAYVPEAIVGPVRIVAGAVNVPEGSVDDRGVRSADRWSQERFDPAAVAVGREILELPGEEDVRGTGGARVADALSRYREARETVEGLTEEDFSTLVPARRVSRRKRTRWHNTETGELVEVEVEPVEANPWGAPSEGTPTIPASPVGWRTPGS